VGPVPFHKVPIFKSVKYFHIKLGVFLYNPKTRQTVVRRSFQLLDKIDRPILSLGSVT